MKRARHTLVYAALAWAFIAPCYVYLSSNGEHDVARRLRALAGAGLGGTAENVKAEADTLAQLAHDEQAKDDRFMMIALLSSGVIVGFCCVSMTRIYRERHVT